MDKRVTHGMSKTKTYRCWWDIRKRCNNKNLSYYKNYGGRGITYCKDWDNFELFLRDMGECPIGFTIERLDVNADYNRENCVWATRKQQGRNRRTNRIITYKGISKPVCQWSEDFGWGKMVIINRLNRGWSVDDALTRAVVKRNRPRL